MYFRNLMIGLTLTILFTATGYSSTAGLEKNHKDFEVTNKVVNGSGIKTIAVQESTFLIRKRFLISEGKVTGLYRYRAGKFKFIPVKVLKEGFYNYQVKYNDIKFGDQIVTDGADIVKLAELKS